MSDSQPCPNPDCDGELDLDGRCPECSETEEDLDGRTPCPDGACIGLIGPDGRCTECSQVIDLDTADEERLPCPDGACIGVIGPDGRCTECGALGPDEDDRDEDDRDEDDRDEDEDDRDEDDELDDDGERFPCPDGACIGIIGPDGRCTECGRTSEESP